MERDMAEEEKEEKYVKCCTSTISFGERERVEEGKAARGPEVTFAGQKE